jgi:hypothetical protein
MGLPASSAGIPFYKEGRCSTNTPPGSHLALPARWWMAYYSCNSRIFTLHTKKSQPWVWRQVLLKISQTTNYQLTLSSGPSGIRTHDLLNAIETRSQLRYGPR